VVSSALFPCGCYHPDHSIVKIPYRSLNEGCMHACGHDGHMAGLLLFVKNANIR